MAEAPEHERQATKLTAARRTVASFLPKRAVGAEVGVFRGRFSQEILDTCRPRKLYLIDPWENQEDPGVQGSWYGKDSQNDMSEVMAFVARRFADPIRAGRVVLCRGYSGDVLAGMADGSLDFIYIDGDHRYEGVAADLAQAWRLVRPGGVIACDDYAIGRWWKDGVVRAVNQFLGRHAGGLRLLHMQGNQVVMRKRDPAAEEARRAGAG